MIKVGIIGASGYTAIELIRLIHNHPSIEIEFLVGNSKAGNELKEIYPHSKFADFPVIKTLDEADFSKISHVFCCLPHGESAKIIAKLPENIKIIDLSSDFRIQDPALYKKFYEQDLNQDFLSDTAYGLSEINRFEIKEKKIIACPGCYPTSILLPLYPLIEQKLVSEEQIIIDAKTGISGAGRKVVENNLFCEINENFFAYNILKHRHLSELIEQLDLSIENLQFTPQVIPATRGIMSMIYVKSDYPAEDLTRKLLEFYHDDYFIKINTDGNLPKLRNVVGTNFCEISVIDSNIKGQKIIISALDNLTKGSSGQALQNFNIINNLDEKTGLTNLAVYP